LFIQTADGTLLNTAYIKRIVPARGRNGRTVAIDSNDGRHELLERDADELVNIIVPGNGRVVFVHYGDAKTAEDLVIHEVDIVAWAIDPASPDQPLPITTQGRLDHYSHCIAAILQPDGQYDMPYDCTFPSKEALIEEGLAASPGRIRQAEGRA
jgi:hypothetical protein